jgi:hypothetical protein
MFDELERLRDAEELFQLLRHYGRDGSGEREAWQDRLMQLDGVPTGELAKLHGELIAYGWVEQNTGVTAVLKPGVAACSYRVTTAGRRALRSARVERPGEETAPEAA